MLKEAIAAARATTLAPGIAEIGDRGLWELLGAAIQRAETQPADPPNRAFPSTADVCIRSPVLPSSWQASAYESPCGSPDRAAIPEGVRDG